jgi:tetratricopeptide (TPR) repeat protein
MRNTLSLFIAASVLLPAAAPASANIIGVARARSCFEAAVARRATRDALESCTAALEEDSLTLRDRAATLVNRGILNMQVAKLDAALSDYDEAIRLQPEAAEAWVNKGIALIKAGRDAEAATVLSHGLDLGPANPAVAHYSRAFAYESLGKIRQAYEDFGRAAALAPGWREPSQQLRRFKTVRAKTAGV